jgi:CheY-like chemotaxis protein
LGIGCRTSTDNATHFGALELRTYGYEVLTCFDGGRCFRTAQTWLPYAAIVDIGLSDMTGYELARALQSLPNGSELLLIAVSGYGNADYVDAARLAGFDWHFQKPARPSGEDSARPAR